MKKEDFAPLLEIQSIELKLLKLDKLIDAEKSRLVALNKLKNNNDQKKYDLIKQKKENTLTLDQKNDLLNTTMKSLKVSKNSLMQATTNQILQNFENEISRLSNLVDEMENEIIELLETEEEIKSKLVDVSTFDKNYPHSFKEIELEIFNENKDLFNQKNSLNDHLTYLKNLIPSELAHLYEDLKSKHAQPVAFLKHNKCGYCSTFQDQFSINNIESFKEIIQCSTCQKIIISQSVQY